MFDRYFSVVNTDIGDGAPLRLPDILVIQPTEHRTRKYWVFLAGYWGNRYAEDFKLTNF